MKKLKNTYCYDNNEPTKDFEELEQRLSYYDKRFPYREHFFKSSQKGSYVVYQQEAINELKHLDVCDKINIKDYINPCSIKAFDAIKSLNSANSGTIWQIKERINNQVAFLKFLEDHI